MVVNPTNRLTIWAIVRSPAVAATDAAPIPVDTVWRRGDGIVYTTSGAATLSVTALLAGKFGNGNPRVILSLVSPLPGIVSVATVASVLTGGAEAESDPSIRRGVLEHMQIPPRGGATHDN